MSNNIQSNKTGRYIAIGVAFLPLAASTVWMTRELTPQSFLAFLTTLSAWTAILTR